MSKHSCKCDSEVSRNNPHEQDFFLKSSRISKKYELKRHNFNMENTFLLPERVLYQNDWIPNNSNQRLHLSVIPHSNQHKNIHQECGKPTNSHWQTATHGSQNKLINYSFHTRQMNKISLSREKIFYNPKNSSKAMNFYHNFGSYERSTSPMQ